MRIVSPPCFLRFSLLTVIVLIAGCASHPVRDSTAGRSASSDPVPVVREGRYRLVEVRPEDAQQDLMHQIVDITLPTDRNTTVGDALHIVLDQSGYGLCKNQDAILPLYALPLPAVHHHLGPLTLREVLQTLAGRGWQLEVDDQLRQVCFKRRP